MAPDELRDDKTVENFEDRLTQDPAIRIKLQKVSKREMCATQFMDFLRERLESDR